MLKEQLDGNIQVSIDIYKEGFITPNWGIAETFKGDNYGERT